MPAAGFLPDEYTWRARLVPELLVFMPLALTILMWTPGVPTSWETLWSIIAAGGGTVLLSELGRDMGKRTQSRLFDEFGGRPTELALTHRHAKNTHLLRIRHEALLRLFPSLPVPSADEERNDPVAAHSIYEAAVVLLMARTRDRKSFALLFEENCNYGFRRNLCAWKSLGVAVAVMAAFTLGGRLVGQFYFHQFVAPMHVVVEATNILFVVLWLLIVNHHWVMVPAREYSNRLMEALDGM